MKSGNLLFLWSIVYLGVFIGSWYMRDSVHAYKRELDIL